MESVEFLAGVDFLHPVVDCKPHADLIEPMGYGSWSLVVAAEEEWGSLV